MGDPQSTTIVGKVAANIANRVSLASQNFLTFERAGKKTSHTYLEFVQASAKFAMSFDTLGLPRGSMVLIVLPTSIELYAAFFGAIISGLVPSILPSPSVKQDPPQF